MRKQAQDLTGRRFGRLVVVSLAEVREYTGSRAYVWLCYCDCAQHTKVTAGSLRNGATVSCGCWRRDNNRTLNTKHGHCAKRGKGESPEYRSWRHIIDRCENPSDKAYANYGGRGIAVCERWRYDFAAFLADMGPKPGRSYSIDRKNNDLGYTKSNCRWATPAQQIHNRRPHIRRGAMVYPRGFTN